MAIPALDGGDFQHLTLSGQLQVIDQAVAGNSAVLLGSSMGGYLAALYAEKHPEIERLVLLAPAFNFRERWAERVGEQQIASWRATNSFSVFHYGFGLQRELAYDLFEDAVRHPAYPNVSQPTLVLQGSEDDVVSPEAVRRFCDLHPNAELKLFAAGHELTNVLPQLWDVMELFLFS